MKLKKYQTFYRDNVGRKHFSTWKQHGNEVMDIKDIVVHE